ncbi:vitamin D3 hydroxylase-associated protein-like [Discoglossus pictus]
MDFNMLCDSLTQILAQYQVDYKVISALGVCLTVSVFGLRWMRRRRIVRRMEQERKRRDASIRDMERAVENFKRQNPGVDRRRVLNLPLMELIEELRDGSISPDCALYSYIEKALEVTKDVNCVTIFLPDCEAQLRELKKQKEKGPLYGVPISIKEHIGYKGQPSTCGLVQYLDVLEEEDSVIVKVLKKQGAVVFAKTNVPQSLICYETSNPIYGHTINPLNKAKGVGGSSGGEGALIGAGGSILGIGSDIGGSIRLPSSFCGFAGFKPSPKRVSIFGTRSAIDGLLSVVMTLGPMARDVDSLAQCMRALLCDEMFKLDVNVPPLPFNEEVYSTRKRLRVGYYEADGYFLPNPGMRRVLLETKKLLEEAGHTLIPFKPPRIQEVEKEFIKACFGDGGETLQEKFKNNIVDPHLTEMARMIWMPKFVKKTLSFILSPLYPRIGTILGYSCGASSVKEHWKHHVDVEQYQTDFVHEWRKLHLDVVLCPMLAPAFNIGYPGKLLAAASCTMLYNIVQFPAGVVPVGSVTSADEEEMKKYTGYSNDPLDRVYKKAVANGVGLPLSVQCAALPYQDELCLHFMKEIETLTRQQQEKKYPNRSSDPIISSPVGNLSVLVAAASCTMLYNIVQFPAGVVPVGSVTSADEEEMKKYTGYSNDPLDRVYKKAVANGVGLPLSVQCAALPYQDEMCLHFMKEIETLTRQQQEKK